MRRITRILPFLVVMYSALSVHAQNLTSDDYTKALWMTTRMYGGQRSGEGPNWLIMDHEVSATDQATLTSSKSFDSDAYNPGQCFVDDADDDYSLSGGWVDCGDHVKFGQTMFYAAYVVLKGYDVFTAGYDDYYSYDYSGYQAAGDFSWDGGYGTPNGIPDVLDELKYECEFFIKCARSSTEFYSQVGDGDLDHQNWVTSVAMAALPLSQGGEADGARSFVKNPTDASMPSFCAATLALMSRVYEAFDADFAAECLTHAVYAYTYAQNNPGTASAGSYYGSNARWQDDYVTASAELYWATGDESYKTEAISYASYVEDHNWTFCYANNDDVAAYNLAKLGYSDGQTILEDIVSRYKSNVNSAGISTIGDSWGILRYANGNAFAVALLSDLNGETSVDSYVANQVDYTLGDNDYNQSYVVGFTPSDCSTCESVARPHHRNVYLCDDVNQDKTSITIPTRNAEHGYMIGGSLDGTVSTDADNYTTNEGGIDYNAGLVGALGYINSLVNPVDTNKFGHPTPELGEEQSLCGTGSVTLTVEIDLSNLESDESITYNWYKDESTTAFSSGASVTVTEAGTYTCEVEETSGAWTTSDDVVVSATLADVDLGDDFTLCEETSLTMDAGVSGDGITYQWSLDGTEITDATEQTYTTYSAGTYSVAVSASGCSDVSDEITVTSDLPEVQHDTICAAGTAGLAVLTTGDYEWYDSETDGTLLESGSTYKPTITESTTFYVQDANSIAGSVGPTSQVASSTSSWGVTDQLQLAFTIGASFSITSIEMPINSVYGAGTGTVTVEIIDGDGNAFSTAKTFTSDEVSITTDMAGTLVEFPFTDFDIDLSWGTSLRMILSSVDFNGALGFHTSGASYPYDSDPSGVVSITGSYQDASELSGYYLYFYNWQIQAGSSCARTPVLAVIDPNAECTATDSDEDGVTDDEDVCPYNAEYTTTLPTWYEDADEDGYGDPTSISNDCEQPTGYVTDSSDQCPDNASLTEPQTWYEDADEDGYGDENSTVSACSQPTGYVSISGDLCPENGSYTISLPTWYEDSDGDGYGDPNTSTTDCSQPTGYVADSSDECPNDINKTEPGNCGCGVLESSCGEQTIEFTKGWNLISFYIIPDDPAIETVFSSVLTSIEVIKNSEEYYLTENSDNFNTLEQISVEEAYLVKATADFSLTVSGDVASNTTISLKTGWNMIGYPSSTSQATETVLSDIWNSSFEIIKGFEGFKDSSDGSLDDLDPGVGYFIKVSDDVTLTIE